MCHSHVLRDPRRDGGRNRIKANLLSYIKAERWVAIPKWVGYFLAIVLGRKGTHDICRSEIPIGTYSIYIACTYLPTVSEIETRCKK